MISQDIIPCRLKIGSFTCADELTGKMSGVSASRPRPVTGLPEVRFMAGSFGGLVTVSWYCRPDVVLGGLMACSGKVGVLVKPPYHCIPRNQNGFPFYVNMQACLCLKYYRIPYCTSFIM